MEAILALKASVLLAAALGAAAMLRRASATARHQVWTLAIAALLGLPLMASVVPQLPVPMPPVWRAAAPAAGSGVPGPTARSTVPAPERADLSTILGRAWLAGSLVAVAMVLLSLWRVHRLRVTATELHDPAWQDAARDIATRLQLAGAPRLLQSPAVRTPMAGGLWRPAVFIPAAAQDWSHETRDIVLAHELAHLARRDPLRHVMLRLAVALYWFHPLTWLAARQARAAQEQACDEAVLSLGARASVYARVLMDLAASPAPAHLAALPMSERPFLETRIMAILNAGSVSTPRRTLTLAAIGIALLTLSVAAAQPRAQTPAPGQRPAPAPAEGDVASRNLDWKLIEAEVRARMESMKTSEATMQEQLREARRRAETDLARSQEDRGRAEVAATMLMLEKLSRNEAILTARELSEGRERTRELARKLAEIDQSLQREIETLQRRP